MTDMAATAKSTWRDYKELTKPNVVLLMILTSVIGMFMAVPGMVPLLFASGAGANSRFAIGIVVVMGMFIGTLFTLFILPTVYSFIAKDHRAASQSERAAQLAEGGVSHV